MLSSNMSERGSAIDGVQISMKDGSHHNPYISSERLNREPPLKFGLRRKSYNEHLTSNMEARSPNLDCIGSEQTPNKKHQKTKHGLILTNSGQTNVIISSAQAGSSTQAPEDSQLRSMQNLPSQNPNSSKGNFFNSSSKTLQKPKEPAMNEARMSFALNSQTVPEPV